MQLDSAVVQPGPAVATCIKWNKEVRIAFPSCRREGHVIYGKAIKVCYIVQLGAVAVHPGRSI